MISGGFFKLGVLAFVFLAMVWMFHRSGYNLYLGAWLLIAMQSLVSITLGLARLVASDIAVSDPRKFRWQINIITLQVAAMTIFCILAGMQILH